MLPFKLVYSDAYQLPIGNHVFPAEKYRRIHDRLISDKVAEPADFLEPEPATDQDILLVHKPEYVQKLRSGTLSPREEMEMEIPYSRDLVESFWLAAGDRFSQRGRRWSTKCASALAADFITPFRIMARASA